MLLTCSAGISSGLACWRRCSSISSRSSATTIERSLLISIEPRRRSSAPTSVLGTVRSSTDGLGPMTSTRNDAMSAPPVAPMKKM